MFCLSCSGCPALAVLPFLFCPACLILAVLYRKSCPGSPALAAHLGILSCQSCSTSLVLPVSFVCPVLAVQFLPVKFFLSSSACPGLTVQFYLSFSACPLLLRLFFVVLFLLFGSGFHPLSVLPQLCYLSSSALAVLSWQPCHRFLSWLLCPGSPV
jgi:hypothetical protein